MDKKNTTIGVILLLVGLAAMFWQQKQAAEQRLEQAAQQREQAAAQPQPADTSSAASNATTPTEAPTAADKLVTDQTIGKAVATPEPKEEEQVVVLENDFIRVELTSWGGAIKNVAFKKYAAHQDEPDVPYVFNRYALSPAMALGSTAEESLSQQQPAYEVVESDASHVVFRRQSDDASGVFIERSYAISTSDEGPAPYSIEHHTRLINQSANTIADTLYIGLGTARPSLSDRIGYNLAAGYYDGSDYDYERASAFTGGGFFFMKKDPKPYIEVNQSTVWGSVKNQFFGAILTPQEPAEGYYMKSVTLPHKTEGKEDVGVTAAMKFETGTVAPNNSADLSMSYYCGPKEYKRLAEMAYNQDEIMQFGWTIPGGGIISFVGKLFYTVLVAVQHVVVNWGVAIIVMTILIRLLFWPLTAKAAESSRRMAKLQGPIKELREKYKDNPKKLNEEMMALWKKHKVNPAAGCLPLIIQMPIFIAFYYMLRGASELRFAHFLWISDLSLPDTVAHIGGFPLNILPLFMGATMFFQMHLAPTPTTDATQAKIMKFMPLIFLFFCYNFSSGLVLYWTTSNAMSILQQLHTNHKRRQEEEADAAEGALPAATAKKAAHHRAPGNQKPKGKGGKRSS